MNLYIIEKEMCGVKAQGNEEKGERVPPSAKGRVVSAYSGRKKRGEVVLNERKGARCCGVREEKRHYLHREKNFFVMGKKKRDRRAIRRLQGGGKGGL